MTSGYERARSLAATACAGKPAIAARCPDARKDKCWGNASKDLMKEHLRDRVLEEFFKTILRGTPGPPGSEVLGPAARRGSEADEIPGKVSEESTLQSS